MMAAVHESVLDAIGGTPLFRLARLGAGIAAPVYAKAEFLNIGGSVKDRAALSMVLAAEREGLLAPGGTIIEATSGNTGIGLAIVGRQRGYRVIAGVSDKASAEKADILRAYGAEVVLATTSVPQEDPQHLFNVVRRLTEEIPGAWLANQYDNLANPDAHVRTTGPEVWEQTGGRVTHFVAGVGTGGTISGTGNYLKEVSGGKVKVVGADPEGSVYSGGTGRPYLVEGVGEDFWPTAYDRNVADEIVAVSDKDSFQMTRRLAKEEGLLVGGSCGMAVVAALEVDRKLGPDDVVVVLLPDGGRGYLSKIFNDDWMADYGFLPSSTDEAHIGEVLARKESVAQGGVPQFVHMHPNETVAEAVRVLREYGVSQMPVVSPGAGHPDIMAGEVIGSVVEKLLLEGIFAKEIELTDTLDKVMSKPLPVVGSGETVTNLMTVLEKADAAVVLVEGKPQGIVTRQDLLSFLTTRGAH